MRGRSVNGNLIRTLASVAWLALAGGAAAVDLPVIGGHQSLMDEIRAAGHQAPSSEQTAAMARQRLSASIEQLEKFLAGGGNDVAARWQSWLQLPELKTELQRVASDQ